MTLDSERRALASLNGTAKANLPDAGTLKVAAGGHELLLRLPEDGAEWAWDDLLDFHHALPGRARGDQREMLLTKIVKDAAPTVTQHESDALREALATQAG